MGSPVDVLVHEHKDYGVVCDFPSYPDIVGLAAPNQVAQQPQRSELLGDARSIWEHMGLVGASHMMQFRQSLLRPPCQFVFRRLFD